MTSEEKKNYNKKYGRTPRGFLIRKYACMKSRVTGGQKGKEHLYKGKEILDRESFLIWALEDKNFQKLFKEWIFSNFDRKKTPSPDRIDSHKGYTIENLEFITASENSLRGNISRWDRVGRSPHGTYNKFASGCRCDHCKEAKRSYNRKRYWINKKV